MKLKKMEIENYRQFQDAVINFDDELTVLAGANNSGKTSIIELLEGFLKIKIFPKKMLRQSFIQNYRTIF